MDTVSVLYRSFTVRVVTSTCAEEPPRHKRPSPAMLFLRDAGIALAFVVSILLAMYAYTGLWPPLVVVESESMMHSEENVSYIGVIDTGDMVLVKDVDSEDEVVTYAEGFVTGHRTYGDYGDVIIFNSMGNTANTPIIHRAVVYLVANPDGNSYSCEALRDLPSDKWALSDSLDSWDHITEAVFIYDYGYRDATVTINVRDIISSFNTHPLRSGFITRGDHNSWIDQRSRDSYSPVDPAWVVGKARGELPWFGLLKLWFSGTLESEAPENSVRNLWVSMIIIVVVPIALDVVLTYRVRKRISRRREAAKLAYEKEALQQAQAGEPASQAVDSPEDSDAAIEHEEPLPPDEVT